MKEQINKLLLQFRSELTQAQNTTELENLRVRYLGRKGPLQDLMKNLKDCTPEERPKAGKWINDLKSEITCALENQSQLAHHAELATQLKNENIDVTEPGRRRFLGKIHPITQMIDEALGILQGMGFSVQYSPDIESEYYNYWA
ncbi:MAG TPA: hypothetical protein PLO43_04490 [Chlamydiales bacterium]|nr:hypothetical protein [Chlamydiales bacterium]